MEGLAAARILAAAGSPLGHIGFALERTSKDVDLALWALVGRTPAEALGVLNGWTPDGPALREQLVGLLSREPAETSQLACRLGWARRDVLAELRLMAEEGLVDAHEPPEPCGDEALRWFLVRRRVTA